MKPKPHFGNERHDENVFRFRIRIVFSIAFTSESRIRRSAADAALIDLHEARRTPDRLWRREGILQVPGGGHAAAVDVAVLNRKDIPVKFGVLSAH